MSKPRRRPRRILDIGTGSGILAMAAARLLRAYATQVEALRRLVPGEGVIDKQNELRAFESDGLTAYRQPPMVAVRRVDGNMRTS